MKQKRQLALHTYADIEAELSRLEQGCEPLAKWNLAGTCMHIAYFVRGSLDGFNIKISPIVRLLVGFPLFTLMFWRGRMPGGMPTVPEAEPPADLDQAEAVADLRALLERARNHTGPWAPSPLAGKLSGEQWEKLHAMHSSHHFGLLRPINAG